MTKEAKKEEKTKKENGLEISIEEMTKKGVHLGHKISRLHPKMEKYIFGIRNTVHIIDLKKTESNLKKALMFISDLFEKGGNMLLVGTKPPLRSLIERIAQECGIPYVSERWLGGIFTNFEVISKRAKTFKEFKEQKEKGEFEKFSKKERARKERKLMEMEKKFKGIQDLDKVPEAVFICDIQRDKNCLKEAKEKGVKVIAICDTNTDPSQIDYPIPANDDAITSVEYILEKVKEAINKSKIQGPNS